MVVMAMVLVMFLVMAVNIDMVLPSITLYDDASVSEAQFAYCIDQLVRVISVHGINASIHLSP